MVLFARNGGQILFVIVVLVAIPSVAPFDSIPILSQAKSFFQWISGDSEGAKKTQENFLDTAPVFSQAKSLVQAAQHDEEGARETQRKFLRNLEATVDQTPVIGHIKGGVHHALGDHERGDEILKGASSTTGAIVGGILGGPAGAVAGSALVDSAISIVDQKPYGKIDFLLNGGEMSAGEIFDNVAGIGMEALGGKLAKAKTGKGKAATRNGYIELEDMSSRRIQPARGPSGGNPSQHSGLRQRRGNQNLHRDALNMREPLLSKSYERPVLPRHLRLGQEIAMSLQKTVPKIKTFLREGTAKARQKAASMIRGLKQASKEVTKAMKKYGLPILAPHC